MAELYELYVNCMSIKLSFFIIPSTYSSIYPHTLEMAFLLEMVELQLRTCKSHSNTILTL